MKDILSMNLEELQSIYYPKYRADQIFEWLHRHNATTFDEMNNLPKSLREELKEEYHIASCRLVETRSSSHVKKFLFTLHDDILIEAVQMEYAHGYSVCISTQAGCRMGCRFCASGGSGLLRNLTAGEMCAQVYALEKGANIVLMGCGEPLDNFEQSIRFLELINHPKGANVGGRHITISTCGLVPQIRELAELKLQINLAISLHAHNDQCRQEIMPIAKRYPLNELIEACRYYIEMTNRRITFEYALIRGLNDSTADAAALQKLLSGLKGLCHVNLIPVNPTNGLYSPTLRKEAEAFAAILKVPATIRRTIGAEVDAACGQLVARS